MKKNSSEKKNATFLSKNDVMGILEGLDISINYSIIPFLAFYFFRHLELKFSIIITLSILCLSFGSRIIIKLFRLNIQKLLLITRSKFFFLFLFVTYSLPVITLTNDSFFYINLIILIFSRITFGVFIAANNALVLNLVSHKYFDFFNLKYFISILFGIFIGLTFFNIINQTYSNFELNMWAWKILYFPILLFIIFIYFLNINSKEQLAENESSGPSISKKLTMKIFFRNFPIIIPLIFILLFCFKSWLPGTVNPENMFFSEIKLIHIIFLTIISIFSNLIFQLVGKNKSNQYFSYFVLFLSLIFFFTSGNKSTYSINILHFFISFISAISISLFFYEINFFKEKIKSNLDSLIFILNLTFLMISVLIPLTVYFLIYFILEYNIIYLLIAFIYMTSLLSNLYFRKKGL